MTLIELRNQIDEVDNNLIELFERRMQISAEIALYKNNQNLKIHDPKREEEKLSTMLQKTDERFRSYGKILYPMFFELSRSFQNDLLKQKSES